MAKVLIPKFSLVLMVGPSGSGKSSLAARLFKPEEVFSSDSIREEINGDFRSQENHGLVFKLLHQRVEARLKSGKRAVVDATNLKQRDRKQFTDHAFGADIFYLVINRALPDKLKTGGWRLDVDGLIERHDRIFRQFEAQILNGDGLATVVDSRVDTPVIE